MATYTITLPDSHTVTSRGVAVDTDLRKLVANFARLTLHGLEQKIGDSASTASKVAAMEKFGDKVDMKALLTRNWLSGDAGKAEVEKYTRAMMEKARDQLEAGEWKASRSSGGTVDEATYCARLVTRAFAKDNVNKAEWATFTRLENGDQMAKLDEWFAQNEPALRDAVAAKVEARATERAGKAKVAASGLTFKL